MPNTAKVDAGTSAQASPAAYELDVCMLTTNSHTDFRGSKEFDIRGLVSGINIRESLYRSSIFVEISILDAANMFEILKLAGNEKISITLQQTELKKGDTGDKNKFEIDVYIAEIGNYSKPKPGVQLYTFTCIAEHAYVNNLKILSKKFEGSISKIIKQISKKDLALENVSINESSKGQIKGIFPSIRPLDAIRWLLRNASEDSTPYFYWQTAAGDVYLDSYKALIEADVHRTYSQKPFDSDTIGDDDYYVNQQKKIRKITSELGMGKFMATRLGSYASTMHSLDISTKKYSVSTFNNPHGLKNMNVHGGLPKEAEFLSKKIPEFSESKNYYIVENSASHESFGNYHNPIVPTLLKTEAYINNMDFQTQDIELNGDFLLHCGKMIEIEIPKSSTADDLEDERGDMIDYIQSGFYMVTEITHRFSPEEYTMDVRCKRDSLILDLDGE